MKTKASNWEQDLHFSYFNQVTLIFSNPPYYNSWRSESWQARCLHNVLIISFVFLYLHCKIVCLNVRSSVPRWILCLQETHQLTMQNFKRFIQYIAIYKPWLWQPLWCLYFININLFKRLLFHKFLMQCLRVAAHNCEDHFTWKTQWHQVSRRVGVSVGRSIGLWESVGRSVGRWVGRQSSLSVRVLVDLSVCLSVGQWLGRSVTRQCVGVSVGLRSVGRSVGWSVGRLNLSRVSSGFDNATGWAREKCSETFNFLSSCL